VSRFASSAETWDVTSEVDSHDGLLHLAALPRGGGDELGWALANVGFMSSNGTLGRAIFDTGASVTAVTSSFVKKAKVAVLPFPSDVTPYDVLVADGKKVAPLGVAHLPVTLQLMLETDNGQFVHWDRQVVLRNVWVLPLGEDSPRDLYVSFRDWRYNAGDSSAESPLGSLVHLVMTGAKLLDTPRAPPAGGAAAARIVIQRGVDFPSPTLAAVTWAGAAVAVTASPTPTDSEIHASLLAQIDESKRSRPAVQALLDGCLARKRIFGPLVSDECTQVVDFELVGEPVPVSFRVPIARKAQSQAANEGLEDWLARGIAERVAWSEPSYGFVIVVPKPNGKFRVTINPVGVNNATRRVDPEGGFMPESLLREAMSAGRQTIAAQMDLTEAFLTLKLGPTARKLSTFTTPLGKLRWRHGYFGWHSFPAVFQRVIMELVVLPALDMFPESTILAWIDDLVAAADNEWTLVAILLDVMDRILAIGGRLSLPKCHFFVTMFDWCGVEVDLPTQQWRIARRRVETLASLPVPADVDALRHVLGIIRYYYFGVADHKAQRERLALLAELEAPGVRVSAAWTSRHTTAFREALDAIVRGDWQLVFDPTLPVVVTTDASGGHGYSIVANQFDRRTGVMRPVSFFSKGWEGTQVPWSPQVKECYAQREAVAVIMPDNFPFADVVLLTDNKNLAAVADSKDKRVVRWQNDIKTSGCIQRGWIPGEWNSIADYGSRAVLASPDRPLSKDEEFETYIYSLSKGEGVGRGGNAAVGGRGGDAAAEGRGGVAAVDAAAVGSSGGMGPRRPAALTRDGSPASGETAVPGHLPIAPITAKIVDAQDAAPASERATWTGRRFSVAVLGGRTLALFDNRLVVPQGARNLKTLLLKLAHDEDAHFRGTDRTLAQLKRQVRVHWVGMDKDVAAYIEECWRCKFAKPPAHKPALVGTLSPTLPPYVHHTWYVDLKGPMPHGTGYLLAVVEPLTRFHKLRYLPSCTAKEVIEELHEVIVSFGTRPVVIRSDGGQPFDSADYKAFCNEEGMTAVLGIANHSSGQGSVETRFRGIAASIIATLGFKAARTWFKGPLLARLESIINETHVASIGGSPSWAMYGHEPRTRASAACDWTATDFGERALGIPAATAADVNELIAAHHAQLDAVQGRVTLASSLAQALTKRDWDAARVRGDFKAGDWVLLHVAPLNRLLPHFQGPYELKTVTADGNFVMGRHFLSPATRLDGPFHVSRLLHFDMSRATPVEIAEFQLDAGSAIVESVEDHRYRDDGTLEFLIRWLGYPVPSWLESPGVRKVSKVIDYCAARDLPAPGTERKKQSVTQPAVGTAGVRGRGRGRGRGGRGGGGR